MVGVKGRSGKKDTLWADAIRVAVQEVLPGDREGRRKLRVLADRIVDAALEGDIQAAKEIGDRLDGKAIQPTQISGSEDEPLRIEYAWQSQPPQSHTEQSES